MILKLTSRLQFIFDQLRPGEAVWDLCCDHGYLGISALHSGRFPSVHFCDQVEHIIENLRAKISHFPQSVFHAKPAEMLEQELTGNVVIAGIGAERIIKILQSLEGRGLMRPRVMVLGPQKDEALLADYLGPKQGMFEIKVFKIPEGDRQRMFYVLESKSDSGMV